MIQNVKNIPTTNDIIIVLSGKHRLGLHHVHLSDSVPVLPRCFCSALRVADISFSVCSLTCCSDTMTKFEPPREYEKNYEEWMGAECISVLLSLAESCRLAPVSRSLSSLQHHPLDRPGLQGPAECISV